jgi:hypothetical protein
LGKILKQVEEEEIEKKRINELKKTETLTKEQLIFRSLATLKGEYSETKTVEKKDFKTEANKKRNRQLKNLITNLEFSIKGPQNEYIYFQKTFPTRKILLSYLDVNDSLDKKIFNYREMYIET